MDKIIEQFKKWSSECKRKAKRNDLLSWVFIIMALVGFSGTMFTKSMEGFFRGQKSVLDAEVKAVEAVEKE